MESLRVGASVGPYVIETLFREGRGGFSQVVVARRRSYEGEHELVALKFAKTSAPAVSRDQAEQLVQAYELALKNEVEILRRLKHPGIVRIYPIPFGNRNMPFVARAAGIEGQPWFFCMEYLAGGTVEALVEKNRLLPISLAVEIAQQVCLTLDYLHGQGYAHLDIKPHNIMLRAPLEEGVAPQAVLVDFGTAQKRGWSTDVEGGSIAYLPPERLREMQGTVAPELVLNNAAVDIYCLGVSLYRMLCECLPFSGSRSHITTAILNDAPTRPSIHNPSLRSHPDLDGLILQMMSKNPTERPSAKEVAEALDTIVPPPRYWPAVKVALPSQDGDGAWKRATIVLSLVALLQFGGLAFLWQTRAGDGQAALTPAATLAPPALATPKPSSAVPRFEMPGQGPTIVIESGELPSHVSQATATRPGFPTMERTSTLRPTHTPTRTSTPRPRPTATEAPTPEE